MTAAILRGALAESHTEYAEVKDTDLTKMLEENLAAERIVEAVAQLT